MDASSSADLTAEAAGPPLDDKATPRRLQFDWQAISQSPAFIPGVVVALALGAMFWNLLKEVPHFWFGEQDGLYTHGVLVPFISAYVVYRWWPNLVKNPVRPSNLALIPLILVLFLARPSIAFQTHPVSSVLFIAAILCAVAFVAGWRWMLGLSLPAAYLVFGLPMWGMWITSYTNPLQTMSTRVAFKMLELTGFGPFRADNVIYLNGFTLDVGVPCSGLKLVLALYAFTVFFVLIARLRWWANLILLFAVPLPLALFINGLRIAMIGVVGVNWGTDAGHQFHDYSGYISLIVCFFILFKVARLLGWKD